LFTYVITLVIGQSVAVAIGLLIERYSSNVSMIVWLTLDFLMFWVTWRIAVRLTEPRSQLANSRPDKPNTPTGRMVPPRTIATELR
jgi:hypothetical protein